MRARVCVYVCLFKSGKPNSSESTLILKKEEAHSVTSNLDSYKKEFNTGLNTLLIFWFFLGLDFRIILETGLKLMDSGFKHSTV